MPIDLRHTLAIALAAAALVGAGCGGDGGSSSSGVASAPARTPDPAEQVPTVTFRFEDDGLSPQVGRVTVGPEHVVDLAIVSADGRPHGVVVTAGGRRTRLVVNPGQTAGKLLQGMGPGRYRVVPDGATAPVTLVVSTG